MHSLRRLLLAAIALASASFVSAQVVINELVAANSGSARDDDGDASDWVELLALRGPVDLEGWGLSDDARAPGKWLLPQGTRLVAGERLVVWCSGKDWSTVPRSALTPDSSVPFLATLITPDVTWRYLAGAPADPGPPPGWHAADFDDAAWPAGTPGFGFGDDDDTTVLPEGTSAVFLRHRFHIDAGSLPPVLVLSAWFDDGIALWLNGERVLSYNVPVDVELDFTTFAFAAHEARSEERFDLSSYLDLLVPGENVAAVAVLNVSATSNDLSLVPALGTVPPEHHASFRLESEGESVLLTDANGAIVDAVVFPAQVPDQSWARSPDGSGDFRYHRDPTPNAENTGPTADEPLVTHSLHVSPERGFHDDPFDVEISSPDADAEIRYTLDGSAPTLDGGLRYTGPVRVADTTTLRARAFRGAFRPSSIATHTYIFIETPDGGGALHQSILPEGFPSRWNTRTPDYAMDPRVTSDAASPYYDPGVRDGLLSLPSISLVADRDDLFDAARGIYSNPGQSGPAWERPASCELIYPDGTRGFQIDAGLRIQGGASRNLDRPKHNLRLLFKSIYGESKLRYPLFEDSTVDEFDTIVLRGGNGDSWFHPNATQQTRAQYIRDQWHRDAQMAMGQPTTHQLYAHLWIDGLYWGVYHIFERPSAPFLASTFGGEKEEYDALNLGEPVDGDLVAWSALMRTAGEGAEDPEVYGRVLEYLDAPNLVDFLLVNFYSGNIDWDHNNWYAGRRREPGAGYRFFVWDAERTFWTPSENRTVLDNPNRPTGLHQQLTRNTEYRQLFADHVQRHFFHDGVLTPERAEAIWRARADEVAPALSAETARWGDNKRPAAPYQRDVEWLRELESLQRTWFPSRTDTVVAQLRARGLWPALAAPAAAPHGGPVERGTGVRLVADRGEVWFTTDGSDPRLEGGAISPSAQLSLPPAVEELVAVGAAARWHVPVDDRLGLDWTADGFDDSTWDEAVTGLGYDRSGDWSDIIATDLEAALYDRHATLLARIAFDARDIARFDRLRLSVRWDDGFAAWLNGTLVASDNVPDDLRGDVNAPLSRSDRLALEPVDFELDDLGPLREGPNVLAIQVLNRRAADSDLLLIPTLAGVTDRGARIVADDSFRLRSRALLDGEWSPIDDVTFTVREALPLRIGEILFHPAGRAGDDAQDPDDFEFLELENTGDDALDLVGVTLRGGVEFDIREPTIVPPGGVVVLARDRDAFAARNGHASPVLGEYVGRLSNDGERLLLLGPIGEVLDEVHYDDDWFPDTDGGGRSIERLPGAGDPNVATSWRASEFPGGTPGWRDESATGGRRRPGDASPDGRLDLSDAVRLLSILFAGAAPPCPGDARNDGNHVILDVDGSDRVDVSDAIVLLSYLFRGGPLPALGASCRPVTGCDDRCAD